MNFIKYLEKSKKQSLVHQHLLNKYAFLTLLININLKFNHKQTFF